MSLDPNSRGGPPGDNVHINHWCSIDGCKEWGGFGFTTGSGTPTWWCWDHYPHKPNKAKYEAQEIADAIRL